jgi:two-component system response regulator (stage 0 sporulation protein A)
MKSEDQCIPELLSHFGISSQYKGYQYIYEAVNLVIAQPDLIHNITKQLYPKIGAKFHCSPLAVERSIRHAIEVANNGKPVQCDDNFICGFQDQRHRLTNGEFISLISSKAQSRDLQ